jgi:hypothetical protein
MKVGDLDADLREVAGGVDTLNTVCIQIELNPVPGCDS